MIPVGVAIVVGLAVALAVLAAIVVGMYLLRNFVPPDQRGSGGTEDPRRTCHWENFCCMYGLFAFIFLAALASFVAYMVFQPPSGPNP